MQAASLLLYNGDDVLRHIIVVIAGQSQVYSYTRVAGILMGTHVHTDAQNALRIIGRLPALADEWRQLPQCRVEFSEATLSAS